MSTFEGQGTLTNGAEDASQLPNSSRESSVARVLGSRAFAGSARLTAFLRFICDEALAGRAAQLNEHSIGQRVFGRPECFNPSEDSVVRSGARLLRQRLERYYLEEGGNDSVRIVVPRGSYVPVFVETAGESVGAPAPVAAAPSPSPLPMPVGARGSRRHVLLAAGGVAAALATGWTVQRLGATPAADDISAAMWSTLLTPQRDLLIVPADSGLVMWQSEHGRALPLADYIGTHRDLAAGSSDAAGWSAVHGRRYTGVVSMRLAVELTRRAGPAASRVRVRFARDLQLNELKEANAVLIGAGNANPWVQLFRDQCVFRIDLEPGDRLVAINSAPRGSELQQYVHVPNSPDSLGYAHIALKRNLSGRGHVLMVGGTGSAGTEAGIDFLLDPTALPAALQQLNPAGAPWDGFEILLQARLHGDNSVDHTVLATRFWPRA